MCGIFKIIATLVYVNSAILCASYWDERNKLLHKEKSRVIGSHLELNSEETVANAILMSHKFAEYDAGFENPKTFPPARHFFDARRDIEKSKVFQFIQEIPKGASLHGHASAMVSGSFVYNLTHRENLYACKINGELRFHFFKQPVVDGVCNWTLVSILRSQNISFDPWLRTQLTLETPKPREVYTDIKTVWDAFEQKFRTVNSLLAFAPLLQEFIYQALKEAYLDNVMYLEFKSTFRHLYDLDGNIYGPMNIIRRCMQTVEEFNANHTDFIGARFIYAPSRNTNKKSMKEIIETARELKRLYPSFMAGFDLVGSEHSGNPLSQFVDELATLPKDIKLFFHAGETNWNGAETDNNLLDAIQLGSSRIGHGYAIVKHPELMVAIKERDIAVEVCPISNQVLHLVDDLRNHPASILIADNYSVVIGNDDPGFWGAKGLSYDWYLAFMGMARRDADLKLLKQLAMNSIKYSGIPEEEKNAVFFKWENQWDSFVKKIIREWSHVSEDLQVL